MAAAKEAAGSASEYDGEDEEVDDECEVASDEDEDEDGKIGSGADEFNLLPCVRGVFLKMGTGAHHAIAPTPYLVLTKHSLLTATHRPLSRRPRGG